MTKSIGTPTRVRECQRCAGTGNVCPRCQCSSAACEGRHERAGCPDCKGTGTVPVLYREARAK